MNKVFKIGFLTTALAISSVGCSDDFVETQFQQNVIQAPLTSTSEMQSFVRGIYSSMRATSYYGADFLAYGEVRSDEMYSTLAGGYYQNVYNYTMQSSDPYAVTTYNQIYTAIAKANIVINTDLAGVDGGTGTQGQAKFAQGQAYGLRAIAFFDAFRLYGQKYIPGGQSLGIVLPLQYDPKAVMPRATIAETEAQIDADFTKALQIMTANNAGGGKTDFSLNALKGMMSRFYLYKGDYAKVRSLTDDLHNKYQVADANSLQTYFSFVMNGAAPNSIFELAVGINASLSTGSYRQRLNSAGYGNIAVTTSAYNQYDPADIRRGLITTTGGVRFLSNNNGTGKYTNTVGADNIKMLRYEEVLLNGVEAELNGGSTAKALGYYNEIVTKRGLPAATTVNMAMLQTERMKELLGEGLRQWDLRRWGLTVPRPGTANTNPNYNAFPIPRGETDLPNSPIIANPDYDN